MDINIYKIELLKLPEYWNVGNEVGESEFFLKNAKIKAFVMSFARERLKNDSYSGWSEVFVFSENEVSCLALAALEEVVFPIRINL